MSSRSAREWIGLLFAGSLGSAEQPSTHDPLGFPGYTKVHRDAARSSGESEAVLTGPAKIGEVDVSAAVFEFGFLGGSMGIAAGDALEAAMDDALARKVPFVTVTSSGGARMQEGMAALAQMPRTVAASSRLARAGLPRITVLGHPTTGGVYASFASLSDFIVGEADATIGFAGPRVVQTMTEADLPPGSHTAEAALKAGLVDAVLEGKQIRKWLRDLTSILDPRVSLKNKELPSYPPSRAPSPESAWEAYSLARHPDRPSPSDYITRCFNHLVELRGDRAGADDEAIFTALGRVSEKPVFIVALDRKSPTAAGFRKCRRIIELAGRLGVSLLTFVDTPGADPSPASEYSGLSAEIARTFEALLAVEVPVVSVISGEGGSGGALALACGDIIGIQKNATFSVISPEAAATILHRDSGRAEEVASWLKPTASDLVNLGLADELIGEPQRGAHTAHEEAVARMKAWIEGAFETAAADPDARAARYSGDFTT